MARAGRDYFATWYYQKGGKEKVAKRRKEKYDTDPEYRAEVLGRGAEYREARRAENPLRKRRDRGPVVKRLPDGSDIVLFSIGEFADYVDRGIQAVGNWERDGVIPKTPYRRGARGFRYYTLPMMDAVLSEVGGRKRLFPIDPEMGNRIRQKWIDSGVPVDCADGLDAAVAATMLPDE